MEPKKKIDKTTKDWVNEWIQSIFQAKRYLFLAIALISGTYVLPYFGSALHISPEYQRIISTVVFLFVFIMIIGVIVRTIGLIFEIADPALVATSIDVHDQTIELSLESGEKHFYPITKVKSIWVAYDFRGIAIRDEKYHSYSLPIEPEEIEKKLDELTLKKDVTQMGSQEGSIRYVNFLPI